MDYVDLYCERLGPGLLAEPLNAITNAAFFVAAWAAWRLARRANALTGEVVILLALIAAIGCGSTLFHTFATSWAHVMDVVPILLFQLAFLWSYGRHAIGLRSAPAALVVAAFLAVALYARRFSDLLAGSLTYLPAIAALLILGAYHWRSGKPERHILAAAAGVFALSLFFRTIDEPLCALWPPGTHFVWHLLNPVVLYLCVRALLTARRSRSNVCDV